MHYLAFYFSYIINPFFKLSHIFKEIFLIRNNLIYFPSDTIFCLSFLSIHPEFCLVWVSVSDIIHHIFYFWKIFHEGRLIEFHVDFLFSLSFFKDVALLPLFLFSIWKLIIWGWQCGCGLKFFNEFFSVALCFRPQISNSRLFSKSKHNHGPSERRLAFRILQLALLWGWLGSEFIAF